ncbi:hypothetical protein ACSFXN_15870 [Planococcus sp. 1R117A]
MIDELLQNKAAPVYFVYLTNGANSYPERDFQVVAARRTDDLSLQIKKCR